MGHFLYDTGLDFVVEGLEVDVRSAAHDMERGIEVVGPMREHECTGVYEAKCEM